MELIQITRQAIESIPTRTDDNPDWILAAPSVNETEIESFQASVWAIAFDTEMGH
jgi:hypothetical protein